MQEERETNAQPSRGHEHKHHHGRKGQKSGAVMVYTVAVCLSCLYLETQVAMPLGSTSSTFWATVGLAIWPC
jgi:hypothetical protein